MEDERVRDTEKANHRVVDGVSVGVDDVFTLKGDVTAKAPGSSGTAYNDCNCRCFLSYEMKSVDKSGESGIIKEKDETAVEDVKHIGNIDLNKLHGITNKKILTDEVVLTNNRISHIIERRGQKFYDEYNQYFSDIISDPDYIFKDQKEDTAIVSKTIKHNDKYVNLVLRLVVEGAVSNTLATIIW